MDDDSEAEKLSPLLITDERSPDLNLRTNVGENFVDDTDDVRSLMFVLSIVNIKLSCNRIKQL